MAVKTREEIIESVKEILADNTDDNTITFLEDITDTITDLEDKAKGDGTDWKAKYTENDEAWRKKYKERFYSNDDTDDNDNENDNEHTEPPKKFEDLFTTK